MKRLIVLGLLLAIVAVGFSAFADPIVVGGSSFATSGFEGTIPGTGKGVPTHLGGYHVVGTPASGGQANLLSSPIVVGGS